MFCTVDNGSEIRRSFPPYSIDPVTAPVCCVVLFVVLSLVMCLCVKIFCSEFSKQSFSLVVLDLPLEIGSEVRSISQKKEIRVLC